MPASPWTASAHGSPFLAPSSTPRKRSCSALRPTNTDGRTHRQSPLPPSPLSSTADTAPTKGDGARSKEGVAMSRRRPPGRLDVSDLIPRRAHPEPKPTDRWRTLTVIAVILRLRARLPAYAAASPCPSALKPGHAAVTSDDPGSISIANLGVAPTSREPGAGTSRGARGSRPRLHHPRTPSVFPRKPRQRDRLRAPPAGLAQSDSAATRTSRGHRAVSLVAHRARASSQLPAVPQGRTVYFEEDNAGVGYVTNSSRLWARMPTALDFLFDLQRQAVEAGCLTFRQRGILVTACASALGDSYCSLAWGGRLATDAGTEVAASVLRGDDEALSTSERTLARWARKVVITPNEISLADVADRGGPGSTTTRSSRSPCLLPFASRSPLSTTPLASNPTRPWRPPSPDRSGMRSRSAGPSMLTGSSGSTS